MKTGSFGRMKNASKDDLILLVNDCVSGKTPNGAAIKGIDKKGQAKTSNHQGPSTKRVKFDSTAKEEEMETEIKDPGVIIDEGPESTSAARAPSFFIGKPLKDYDASNGRVSEQHVTANNYLNVKKYLKSLLYPQKRLVFVMRPSLETI